MREVRVCIHGELQDSTLCVSFLPARQTDRANVVHYVCPGQFQAGSPARTSWHAASQLVSPYCNFKYCFRLFPSRLLPFSSEPRRFRAPRIQRSGLSVPLAAVCRPRAPAARFARHAPDCCESVSQCPAAPRGAAVGSATVQWQPGSHVGRGTGRQRCRRRGGPG